MMTCNQEDDAQRAAGAELAAAKSAIFSGRVVNAKGEPVAAARVTINGIVRVTSTTGQYSMSINDTRAGYRLDIRKDGFAPLTEIKTAGALGQIHRLQAGVTQPVNVDETARVRDPASGIEVVIPKGALRSAAGTAAGTVQFTIIPHTSQTMPGDFTAQNEAGERVALISVGAVTLQAVDSKGATLGVSPGQELQIRLPVPASAGEKMPDCVLRGTCRTLMWRFNPATQLWAAQAGAAPAFTSGGTTFRIAGARQGGVIDPADGLGTWNADIEFTNPACTVVTFSSVPLTCYNPGGGSPEPGIDVTFTQALAGGGTKSMTKQVASTATFVVFYNLRANVALDLEFDFPAGAPAGCAANLSITSNPGANPGFPIGTPTGGATQLDTGAPWGGVGMPTNSLGFPITFDDVALGDHPCNSTVDVTTSL